MDAREMFLILEAYDIVKQLRIEHLKLEGNDEAQQAKFETINEVIYLVVNEEFEKLAEWIDDYV